MEEGPEIKIFQVRQLEALPVKAADVKRSSYTGRPSPTGCPKMRARKLARYSSNRIEAICQKTTGDYD